MYYQVKVKIATDTGKGVRYTREVYLVEDSSVTGVETKINGLFLGSSIDFEVTEVKKSEIGEVIGADIPVKQDKEIS